ncbi:MAG: hypothetical protein AAF602_06510, partial [Myxococcota bacterium]
MPLSSPPEARAAPAPFALDIAGLPGFGGHDVIAFFRRFTLAAAGLLAACPAGPDESTSPRTMPPISTTPEVVEPLADRALDVLDVWEELRDTLRESPDHRMARAREAIATGIPEVMYEFVRSELGTTPLTEADLNWIYGSERTAWYGGRGTIRSGTGTPRDRAEALAWMLGEAGFETAVLWATPEDAWPAGDEIWAPTPTRPFAPAPGDVEAWAVPWGGDLSASVSVIDSDGQLSESLARALGPLVAPGAVLGRRDIGLMPVVQVLLDGEPTLLNPNDPTATFDQPRNSGRGLAASLRTPEVSMRVWARHAGTGDEVDLVSGAWPMHEIVGRRIVYRARPLLDLPVALGTPIGDVPLFLPALAVEAPGEDLGTLGVVGAPFAWTGDVFEADPVTGEPTINGRPIDSTEESEQRIAEVASLEVNADPSRFPEVTLSLRPLDANGA